MANKRDFKKYVESVGAAICDEMMIAFYNVEGIDQEKTQESIAKVLGAVGKATSNSNVFFDKGQKAFDNPKEYNRAKEAFFKQLFKKINEDFAREINEALKELARLQSEEGRLASRRAGLEPWAPWICPWS